MSDGVAVAGVGVGASAWGAEVHWPRPDWSLSPPAVLLVLLNLLDGVFTLAFLQLGVAEEANPLMRAAYEQSPALFMLLKLSVVHVGVGLLTLCRGTSSGRIALQAGAALYACIVAYHLAFLSRVLAG